MNVKTGFSLKSSGFFAKGGSAINYCSEDNNLSKLQNIDFPNMNESWRHYELIKLYKNISSA